MKKMKLVLFIALVFCAGFTALKANAVEPCEPVADVVEPCEPVEQILVCGERSPVTDQIGDSTSCVDASSESCLVSTRSGGRNKAKVRARARGRRCCALRSRREAKVAAATRGGSVKINVNASCD